MRKACAFLCLSLVLLAGTAMATQTRVLTLGENGNVMMDESNVSTWPQTLSMYPDRAFGEITGAVMTSGGMNMKMNGKTFGLYFSKDNWTNPYLNGSTIYPAGLDQKVTLLFAQDLAGMPFGVNFSFYGDSHVKKDTNDKSAETGTGIRIGAGMTLMETLETYLQLGILSFEQKDAAGNTIAKVNGGTTIMLGARWWKEYSEMYTLVPHFGLTIDGQGTKNTTPEVKETSTTIDLGIGNNIHITKDILFVHDIGFTMMTGSVDNGNKTDMSNWVLPYFKGGMEGPLSEHFLLRWGGVKEWTMSSHKSTGHEETWSGVNTRFYLGACYTRGNLTVDANVNPGLITDGPYFITGAPGAWASSVTMKYMWGK